MTNFNVDSKEINYVVVQFHLNCFSRYLETSIYIFYTNTGIYAHPSDNDPRVALKIEYVSRPA